MLGIPETDYTEGVSGSEILSVGRPCNCVDLIAIACREALKAFSCWYTPDIKLPSWSHCRNRCVVGGPCQLCEGKVSYRVRHEELMVFGIPYLGDVIIPFVMA